MRRIVIGAGVLVMLGLLAVAPARAFVTSKLPLAKLLGSTTYVCTARVDRLDPARPAVVLTVDGDLKGKMPIRRLPINLEGDSDGKKYKHTPQILKRLAKDLPLILFLIKKSDGGYSVFGYTNGTWFQVLGAKDKDSDTVRWAFTHGEPYLRRTFKGTTAEMRQVIEDALAGKKPAPALDDKAEPGFGPEVKPPSKDSPRSQALPGNALPARLCLAQAPQTGSSAPRSQALPGNALPARLCLAQARHAWEGIPARGAVSARQSLAAVRSQAEPGNENVAPDCPRGGASRTVRSQALPRNEGRGPLFAVIPTVGIGAPLAALAMLFPTVFGGLIVLFRRWIGMLTVVGSDSTLFMLYAWQRPNIGGYWWGTPGAFWTAITAITLLGAVWAWRRHLLSLHADQPAEEIPARTELWTLVVCSVLGLGGVLWYVLTSTGAPSLANTGWKVLLLVCAGFWAGTLYTVAVRLTAARRPTGRRTLPTEGVILWTMAGACAFLTTGGAAGKVTGSVDLSTTEAVNKRGARLLRQVWKFQPDGDSDVSSSPIVAGQQVYIAVSGGNVIEKTGVLYCLNRDTGKEIWHFDNSGKMRPPHSSPCVDAKNGRVYIGEGFHENAGCRLFCLDAANGKKLWDFETNSHTESSPSVVAGKVFFGGGDDGLYCLDAGSGKKLWQYPDPKTAREGLHIDASPTVVGKRLYCGSGVSRTNKKLQVFCLDTDTGKQVWARDDIDLPSWSAPTVYDGRVYFGLANGRLTISDEKPRGAVLCLDAEKGKRLWLFDAAQGLKDAVHTRPAVDRHHVYIGSRDGHVYCLQRRDGKLVWKKDMGSPVVAAVALARCSCCDATTSVYVAASGGAIRCLDPETGDEFWNYVKLTGDAPALLSSPAVQVYRAEGGDRRRLTFASGLKDNTRSVVFCLEDQWREETAGGTK